MTGCSAAASTEATLTFICNDENISVTLTAEETARLAEILSRKKAEPLFGGVPSCGFTADVSITVSGTKYAIACDTCNSIRNCATLRCYTVKERDMAYIHALFENYGGYFPCI